MQFSESWLRSFCNPLLNTQELSALLTMSGLEVEELTPVAPPFSGVVVAEIISAEQHPNADRLRVCQVNVGPLLSKDPLQIVCGAANARPGLKAPLAMVGAQLPPGDDGKPFVINVGKLRGVDSFGMLCAADELGLSKDHAGLLELPADAPVGSDIRAYLDLNDTLFTLKLTPNLAHNLSVFGVAREVAALTGTTLNRPAIVPVPSAHTIKVPVKIEAQDLCGRFTGRVIKNVNHSVATPDWMVRRLERCGQRPVSVLVDISNYVMFEYGQPNHIFDYDKIHGGLEIRWAKTGEKLALLNGKTVDLDDKLGVVADKSGVESLAGIMGGEASSVGDNTKNVYVEAAFWHPEAIAGRSRRLNFSTEAGHRFERGVDPSLPVEQVEYITRLVLDICGGEAGPIDDQKVSIPARKPVALRVERAAKVIGMPISQEQCVSVMKRLGLAFTEAPGKLTVTPPSWRFDITIEEDLIEEIIRVLGFNNLPDTPPIAPITGRIRPENQRPDQLLRRLVASLDYQETINFGFVEERWEKELAGNDNPIKLLNPIAAPLSVMRSSLIGSLVQVLRYNVARRSERVRVFELGRVFKRDSSVKASLKTVAGIDQPLRVTGLAYGPADSLQWAKPSRLVDFFDIKGDVESLLAPRVAKFVPANHPAMHPGRCAAIELDGKIIGHVGELHPRWRAAYELPSAPMIFEMEANALIESPLPLVKPISRQLGIERDISLLVPSGVKAESLTQAIVGSDKSCVVQTATVFDVYRPEHGKDEKAKPEISVAIRIALLDSVNPLTDERITGIMQNAIKAVQSLGAQLRA